MLWATILAAALSVGAGAESTIDARGAFERLKQLVGHWEGTSESPTGPAAAVSYRLIGGGTTLMQNEFPGLPHEMASLIHLDGNDLVLKHYCVTGNQPEMKLDPARSSSSQLTFVFTGGTHLDPLKDPHVHGGVIRFLDENRIESDWDFYQEGKKAGANRFFLKRVK